MYLLDLVEKAEVFPKGLVMLLIEMHEVALAREQQGSHLPDGFGGFRVVHPDFGHVVGQIVANAPAGEARFLIDQGGDLFRWWRACGYPSRRA